MAETNIHSASWSLDILRKDRMAMACLVLSVTFLGCHDPTEAVLDRGAVTRRPEWRPLDADRATAERLGREVVEAIGYEELIEIARRAGFVTKKIKRAHRNDGSMLAMDGAAAAAGVFVEAVLPMITARTLSDAVRDAWASIPAPPAEDLKYMAWGWGEDAAREFTGIAPMDVNITSKGFYAADPLLDLPNRAAAAYLGTYLLALLRSLEFQKSIGIFFDVITRAHVITCLRTPDFWEEVRPFLPPKCREVLAQVTLFVASEHEALALTPEKVDTMRALAADFLKSV
jgi:hypothetical protein